MPCGQVTSYLHLRQHCSYIILYHDPIIIIPADGALPVVSIIIVVWRKQSLESVGGIEYAVIDVLVVDASE